MILNVISSLLALLSIGISVRNLWVAKRRAELLQLGSLEEYDRYLSYDQMMWRFWVWDIKKLKRR